MSAENRTILARAVEAYNSGNLSDYFQLYDESVVLHGYGPQPIDLAGATAFYTGLKNAFPDGVLSIDVQIEEGDKIACVYSMRGTHKGEFADIAPTEKSVHLTGQTMFRFSDGKVVERWNTADVLGLLVQLGAVTPPS
ncbi:MAG: ester cyclase [Proteobacteria bacterium]|nr:ester cyclase [Pseudomonadota bacterium]